MLQVIINLLTLKALSTPVEVYAGLAVVWLLMLSAGIASVWSRRWTVLARMAWCLVLVVLPVAGMTLYCLFSLFLVDYAFLKVLGVNRRTVSYLTAKPLDRPARRQP